MRTMYAVGFMRGGKPAVVAFDDQAEADSFASYLRDKGVTFDLWEL